MTLLLHNTLTQKKEPFVPLQEGQVRMYVCGVTVYDFCHIGHARAYVVFDTIRRILKYLGYHVTYIQNFTDIDDKIINRSHELHIPFHDLTERYIQAYFEDMDALAIERATRYPRATEFIPQIQALIQQLLQKGIAYVRGGDVWFSVDQFASYGTLSKKKLDDLIAGFRVDVNQEKKSPLDFVLWKTAKEGEPSWDSPWGKGRPGWHIECSAMVMDQLGETIDLHCGGEDLIFPHHENEIAQSESVTGKPFAHYWVHNGFVNIHDEKMSKSTKNFYTIREILQKYPAEVVRFFLLKVHYRSALNFSFEGLEEARKALLRLHTTLENIIEPSTPILPQQEPELLHFKQLFIDALQDDFNFSEAFGVLFDLNKWINTKKRGTPLLLELGQLLGLFQGKTNTSEDIPPAILELIEARTKAKQQKEFQKSDELRQQILELGFKIEDTPQGVRVKRV